MVLTMPYIWTRMETVETFRFRMERIVTMMTALILIIAGLVLLDVLALRFGADSRHFDDRASAWW